MEKDVEGNKRKYLCHDQLCESERRHYYFLCTIVFTKLFFLLHIYNRPPTIKSRLLLILLLFSGWNNVSDFHS